MMTRTTLFTATRRQAVAGRPWSFGAETLRGGWRRRWDYAQAMARRRRPMLLLGACVSLLFFVLNVINGGWVLAAIFGVLLVVNARGYLRQ